MVKVKMGRCQELELPMAFENDVIGLWSVLSHKAVYRYVTIAPLST